MILDKKVAIVTGAAKGIGKGIASLLANSGAKVIISDILIKEGEDLAKELREQGREALFIPCNIANKDEIKNLIEQTIAEFGALDILVNNAGIYPFIAFDKLSEEDWDKTLAINLKGVFHSCQESLKYLKEGAKIINISSIASLVAFPSLSHYSASKGAINAFTRSLALELASKKINVNAIAPGAINVSEEEPSTEAVANIPFGKMGSPDDIAQAVLFLASSASNYITGQVLVVDGGYVLP